MRRMNHEGKEYKFVNQSPDGKYTAYRYRVKNKPILKTVIVDNETGKVKKSNNLKKDWKKLINN